MKCPACNKEGYKYLEKRKKITIGQKKRWEQRKTNKARCKKCEYEGVG